MTRRTNIPRRSRFFLGCEGESEQGYGGFLGRLAEAHGLNLHIDAINLQPAGDPLALAEKAIGVAARRTARGGPYVARAILLDADKLADNQQRAIEAQRLLHNAQFIAIWQHQDHEAFLLRHFPGHQHDDPPRGGTSVALQGQWNGYRKGMPARDIEKVLGFDHVMRAAVVTPALADLLRALGFDF